ncbi:MAG: hypothetical protein RL410_1239 [Actinomycetota bacterium]|jgi:uncharacterized protein with FMN-binding domain
MKRGIFIGTGALVGAIGSLVYPAGAVTPSVLVGDTNASTSTPTGGTDLGGGSSTSGERTLTGDAVQTPYGPVQVSIVVNGTQITSVNMAQAPSGRNQRFTDYAIPILTQETLDAQSANISVASGASYTSMGFIQSLQSALSQM